MDRPMPRSKKPADDAFILFDVLYEDGSRTSNRRIATAALDPIDGDASAKAVIEDQDRKIAEMSGRPRAAVKSVTRSPGR
jgi:hypothetical protein